MEETHSWEYGNRPKVKAVVPGFGEVYGMASRWTASRICVDWSDEEDHAHFAWLPREEVHRVTDSEWDIEEYRRCPEHLRGVRWGKRLPGFLPS